MYAIKFANMIFIIIVCTCIGNIKAKEYKIRVVKLRDLKSSFNIFKTKLEFTYEPVAEIFQEISNIIYKNNKNIFKSYITKMKNENKSNAWESSVTENSYGLTQEDIKLITNFGNLLGKTDLNGQLNEICLVNGFIDKQLEAAEIIRDKNEKLYKSLGLIVGFTITIVCF